MNDNAKIWVNLLRSKEYFQTHGRLSSTGHILHYPLYCCLGVACVAYEQSEGTIDPSWKNDTILPIQVRKWLNLKSPLGSYEDSFGNNTSLVQDNDLYMKDFNKIAAIIESEPQGLFEDS